MKTEKTTCPRCFPVEAELDQWKDNRWEPGGSNIWEWPWKPRTCSYCGGIHPQNAMRLIEEGWRIQTTDKGYKRYLHPPKDAGWSPVPPVKLYVQHFSGVQMGAFNATIKSENKYVWDPRQEVKEETQKVSVIMTCFARFENFEKLIQMWLDQPETDEILVWDNSGESFRTSLGTKDKPVLVFNSSMNLGSAARYTLGSLVRNEIVVFGDDDVFPKPGFLADWLPHFRPNRMLGVTGRWYKGTYQSGYANAIDARDQKEDHVVDFVVGYLMMVHRDNLVGFNYRDAAWYCCELELQGKLRARGLEIFVPATDKWGKLPEGDDEHALCHEEGAEEEKEMIWDKYYAKDFVK